MQFTGRPGIDKTENSQKQWEKGPHKEHKQPYTSSLWIFPSQPSKVALYMYNPHSKNHPSELDVCVLRQEMLLM